MMGIVSWSDAFKVRRKGPQAKKLKRPLTNWKRQENGLFPEKPLEGNRTADHSGFSLVKLISNF